MDVEKLYERYCELQAYVGWSADDARRVQAVASSLDPFLPALIEDFYSEIERHPGARSVITGGDAQIVRLKQSLIRWVRELLSGPYDGAYVLRRWRVGRRHVEIGLDQVFTNVAMSRLRSGLIGALGRTWHGSREDLVATVQSLDRLIDLDLAKIEDAYQAEHLERRRRDERLAAIGQISGGIAHELRNPLNVIKTSAYYLLNARSASPEKIGEHLRRIDQHVTVANDAITALSNFAKMPHPELNPFSIEKCVREVLKIEHIPERIRIELDFPPTLPPALGDPAQIRIVFANLIRNARDAMPQGGSLAIRAVADEAGIVVAFADTGIGIPAEQLSRVMEPLYSTKARGLGLGLAMAKAIVEKHHGSLHVTSVPAHGSTFTVRLATAESSNRSSS
jgi:signal transduction histidine kinase